MAAQRPPSQEGSPTSMIRLNEFRDGVVILLIKYGHFIVCKIMAQNSYMLS